MRLLTSVKPSIASLTVRVVHFGNGGRPIVLEPASVVVCRVKKNNDGIIKEQVIPIPVTGVMLRTIVEPES